MSGCCRKALEAEKATVAQYEKEFNAKKKQVDDDVAIINDQLKVKESQRERIAPEVRPDYLSRYERILKNKDGLGIVKVGQSGLWRLLHAYHGTGTQ